MGIPEGALQAQLPIGRLSSDKERFNDQHILSKYVARIPPNGKIYIVLTTQVFQKFICGWFGSVHDCNVLQSRSIEKPCEQLYISSVFGVIDDSDETESLDSWKICTCQGDDTQDMSQSKNDTSD